MLVKMQQTNKDLRGLLQEMNVIYKTPQNKDEKTGKTT